MDAPDSMGGKSPEPPLTVAAKPDAPVKPPVEAICPWFRRLRSEARVLKRLQNELHFDCLR